MLKESEKALIGSAFHILQHELLMNAVGKGFHKEHNEKYYTKDELGNLHEVDLSGLFKTQGYALAVTEIAEAIESVRKPKQDEHCPEFTNEEIENADAIIRILERAEFHGLRLFEAIMAKHEFNMTRPAMHGGKAF